MIESYSFGKFVIAGKEYKSNIKLFDKEVHEYKHLPEHKIAIDDLADLIAYNPKYIIIGTGAYGVIKISKEISDYIQKRGINLIVQKTGEACQTYNALLKEGKKVAALLHNTC